ncbi:transglutaminase family protein [Polaromonas sp. CG_9.11]|uniref:transglutaminase-like domain-containing protein n=1 Tax=Polaromonas sp. CG_9.11 TaxID=2787730 RepID=UPI0018C909F5|nr:transglutaminase family protein [Polaromonas sp. CG_9.11]MBG6077561.1 transglutaminase-like putative cysteine protease [Polaromonas sp. CG_9.11]
MHTSLVDCLLEYEVSSPAHFLLNIGAAFHPGHEVVEERLTITPSMKVRHFSDERSGNRFIRLDAPKGVLTVNYHARVHLHPALQPLPMDETPVSALPDDVLHYLMPSRYCESDSLRRVAQQLFGHLPPGMGRVRAVESWIHESVDYQPGTTPPHSTQPTTTAQDVFVERVGVCRDFAHLAITLCRALNIPARLVVGYVRFAEPPQDFHAVFEAWLDGRWVLFDATRRAPIDRLVRIGTGRDAKDVAFATIFGDVTMRCMAITVDEGDVPADGTATDAPPATPVSAA